MGSNKTFQQSTTTASCSASLPSSGVLRHAVEKAAVDRERAIRNVCRLYGAKAIDALPREIRAAALALLGPQV